MADPEVKLRFAGTSADAERAIATLERRIQQLEQASRQSTRRMKEGVGEFIGQLTGISSPIDVASRAMQVFKAEWDDLLKRQNAAKDATLSFAQELQNAANNANAPLDEVRERMLDISKVAIITPQNAAKLLNIGQAAKGTLDDSAIDRTILAAAKVARLDPGTMEGMVNTSLDLQKQLAGTSPEQSIGFILAAMSKTRVPDTEKFTKNVLPAIIGVNKLDNTSIEFSAALSAGITQAASDTEGRKSRTAMTALALQLRDAFPELKDTEARVRAVQENPELRDAFLRGGTVNGRKLNKMRFDVTGPDGEVLQLDTDRASFERQMVPAMEQVLTKGTFAARMLDESLRDVPLLANSGAEYRRRVKEQEADPNLRLATSELRGRVRAEVRKVEDFGGAESAITRSTVEDDLSAGGFGLTQRYLIRGGANLRSFFSGDYTQGMIGSLESERAGLQNQVDMGYNNGQGASPAALKQIELLTEMLAELRRGQLRPVDRNGGKDD